MAGIAQSDCAPTDQACICTNQELIQSITACVAVNCTVKEQLSKCSVARGVANADCNIQSRRTYLTQPVERL
jgi:hypothetical protein